MKQLNLILSVILWFPIIATSQTEDIVIEESPDQQCLDAPDEVLKASKIYEAHCQSEFEFDSGAYNDVKQKFTLASNRLCDLTLHGVQLRSAETTYDPKVSKNTLSIHMFNSSLDVDYSSQNISSTIYLKTTDKNVNTTLDFDIGSRSLKCTLKQVK